MRPSGFVGRGSGDDFLAVAAKRRISSEVGEDGNGKSQYGQSVRGSVEGEIITENKNAL